jgi:hypothetical protein
LSGIAWASNWVSVFSISADDSFMGGVLCCCVSADAEAGMFQAPLSARKRVIPTSPRLKAAGLTVNPQGCEKLRQFRAPHTRTGAAADL